MTEPEKLDAGLEYFYGTKFLWDKEVAAHKRYQTFTVNSTDDLRQRVADP